MTPAGPAPTLEGDKPMKALTAIYTAMALLMVTGFFYSPAAAEVRPAINYVYFQVPYIQGKSAADMVNLSTPLRGGNGHRSIGLTRWQIRFDEMSFTHPKIDICRIDEPRVTLSCEITLPQLQGGDERARREFEQLATETKVHELEHCRIATKHANELERAFKDMNDYRCKEIVPEIREIYAKIIDDCSVEQKRFDHAEYGYSQYLYLEALQQMQDAGFNVAPPADGGSMPRLAPRKKSEMKVVPQGVEELKQEGIYKDENGVWRNY